jgi:glyoxylase-like metal-dependent hydrolase (beta-lactamase superfamily II)
VIVAAGMLVAISSAHDLQLAPGPPTAAATTTTGAWASMIFVARTDSGVIAIDLGWTGAEGALQYALKSIGAAPADVRWVFLTHAHRDHIGAWPAVTGATFVLGANEVPFFSGTAPYQGLVLRISDRLFSYDRPVPGQLRIVPIAADTMFAFGKDTLRAYPVPGHTAGSTVFVFRETLFAGDAANWRVTSGFRGARPEFSDDVAKSRASMSSLMSRLDAAGVRWKVLCTAHAKCGLADSTLRQKILR